MRILCQFQTPLTVLGLLATLGCSSNGNTPDPVPITLSSLSHRSVQAANPIQLTEAQTEAARRFFDQIMLRDEIMGEVEFASRIAFNGEKSCPVAGKLIAESVSFKGISKRLSANERESSIEAETKIVSEGCKDYDDRMMEGTFETRHLVVRKGGFDRKIFGNARGYVTASGKATFTQELGNVSL